jgi:predicted component of type VI protein secretion system
MVRGEKLFIRDLVSTNGTFVNDEQIQGEIELKNDDLISVGSLLFAVVIAQSAPVKVPVKTPAMAAPSQADDAAAALLLSMTDEPTAPARSEAPTESDIPAGTVEHQVPGADPAAAAAVSGEAVPTSKLEQIKQAQADTSVAASAILTKYLRRR